MLKQDSLTHSCSLPLIQSDLLRKWRHTSCTNAVETTFSYKGYWVFLDHFVSFCQHNEVNTRWMIQGNKLIISMLGLAFIENALARSRDCPTGIQLLSGTSLCVSVGVLAGASDADIWEGHQADLQGSVTGEDGRDKLVLGTSGESKRKQLDKQQLGSLEKEGSCSQSVLKTSHLHGSGKKHS